MHLDRQFTGEASALLEYLNQDGVTDLLINGTESLFIECDGELQSRPVPFSSHESLLDLVQRLIIPLGKRLDAKQPYLDGHLSDGSRFHVILPPIAPSGAHVSIRRFSRRSWNMESLGPPKVIDWLFEALRNRKNLIIAGGTGSGKTTLLTMLLDKAAANERIALLEETKESPTIHPHVVRLESRTAGPEGTGEVTLRDLVRNALRMRPDRIVIGECRGREAFDMLQAMGTGHRGSLTTVHSNSASLALRRLEQLVMLSQLDLSIRAIREWIGSCIEAVIYLKRVGRDRYIDEVIQVQGLEGDLYRILPWYKRT